VILYLFYLFNLTRDQRFRVYFAKFWTLVSYSLYYGGRRVDFQKCEGLFNINP
jgi:hypothetical protein